MKKGQDLQSLLEDVPEGNEFKLYRGGTIKSIPELYILLQRMDPSVFRYHVNDAKNDIPIYFGTKPTYLGLFNLSL